MYDDESSIKAVIDEKEGELSELHSRMAEDFDLFALTEYEAKDASGNARKGYQAYTSSQPRNFFDKVMDGLNQAALTIQILLPEDASEENRRKASKGELYLFGALNAVDRRLAKRGEPPLRESLGYFMCLRGLCALRALVYASAKGKEVVFDVTPWDPLHVTWETGSDGLMWAAYKRQATRAQVLAEYGLEVQGKSAEVIDFWDAERNSVLVDGTFAKRQTAHKIGHVPVLVRFVGSMPTVQTREFAATVKYQGDSVWSASRKLYEMHNRYISSLMDVQERSVVGSLVHQSKDGQKKLEGDPYRTWQEIRTEEGETIVPLELQKAPPETAAILGLVSNDIQQSTLPYPLAYGGTQQAMSGRALSVLSDATRSVYSPRTGAMAQAYTWLCEELLVQFVNKGTKKTELRGYRPQASKEQRFFAVTAGPDDISPDWFVNVRVEPRMPRDEEAAIMMALAATKKAGPEDIPLMSKGTARETLLLLQDPDVEEDKALAEMGKALPPILAANIAAALKRRGQTELAEQVMLLLRPASPPLGADQLPPPLIEAIVAALAAAGQKELAAAFVQALAGQGALPVAPAGPGAAPGGLPVEGGGPEGGPPLAMAPAGPEMMEGQAPPGMI